VSPIVGKLVEQEFAVEAFGLGEHIQGGAVLSAQYLRGPLDTPSFFDAIAILEKTRQWD
jgi:hypothetical protein